MSTSIHIWTEQRICGEWRPADEEVTGNETYRRYKAIYRFQNYQLFAMLADVQNKHGIVPISSPRGLPNNLSPEVRADLDLEHTPSWLTLAELKAYDWSQSFTRIVELDFPAFKEYQRTGKPHPWKLSYVTHPNIRRVSEEYLREMVKDPERYRQPDDRIDFGNVIGTLKWQETYAQAAGEFFSETIPKLEQIAGGEPESVRIVFYFDS